MSGSSASAWSKAMLYYSCHLSATLPMHPPAPSAPLGHAPMPINAHFCLFSFHPPQVHQEDERWAREHVAERPDAYSIVTPEESYNEVP